jgi:anaerobic selenocysteine-containing dehydrogenase
LTPSGGGDSIGTNPRQVSGDALQIKGCCPLDCQDSCSWVAHVDDDRVLRVEGAKDHPITRGVLCAKVCDYEARVTAPDRLLRPLRRTGAKGSGAFEPLSWDEALDTIAQRFKAIVAEHGAEALLPFQYLGSVGVVQRFALLRLFHALGASLRGGWHLTESPGSAQQHFVLQRVRGDEIKAEPPERRGYFTAESRRTPASPCSRDRA